MPADVSTQPDYQITLLDRNIQFDGKRLAKMSQTERVQGPTSAPTIEHSPAQFAVRIVGETIYLKFICPPDANCVSSGESTAHLADGNTLVFGDSQPWVYTRR